MELDFEVSDILYPKRALPATQFPERAWANKQFYFPSALSAVNIKNRRDAESAEGKTDDAPENQSPSV